MHSPQLSGISETTKREELLAYFIQTYTLFESLFELLAEETVYYRQSEPTRHPMIFYFGHTAVFYINKLVLAGVLNERINPSFESMFAVGVDEMHWDEESGRFQWPSVESVREYRSRVRTVVEELIRTMPMELPITQQSPFWAIWMGIEHERIHIETSSVLHRQMPIECIRPHEDFPVCPKSGDAPENEMVPITGGNIVLGKGNEDHGWYGWDNEYGRYESQVGDFEASRYLVSNGEFLPFVEEGGYRDERWWDEEGRKYLSLRQASCPPFWIPEGEGTYRYRALAEEIPLPMNWPVEVNALEAQAFCRWKSAREQKENRLPTEAEWYVMVRECGMDAAVYDDMRANLNLTHYASSVPVDRFAQGMLCDVVGNVWQWTQTPIEGLEGFEPHPWYDDFSTPTFDTKHNLIKGGSWISTGNEIVSTSRYAFRRHFIQHAGFRYVVGANTQQTSGNPIITEAEVARLCHLGYGEHETFVPQALQTLQPLVDGASSVLELGCGAGRLSLELARTCETVRGMDGSARYISPAVELIEKGSFRYRYDAQTREVTLASLGLSEIQGRVAFYQADRSNLNPHVRGYDRIILNTLSRPLPDPAVLAESLIGRLKEGGSVIVLSFSPVEQETAAFGCVFDGEQRTVHVGVWKR